MLLDVRRFLDGDPITTRAFLLIARSLVRRRFRKPSQVDAVVQDTMIEMMAKLEAGARPDPERVEYWILGCANNAVRRELTRVRRATVPYESNLHDDPHAKLSELHRHRMDLERVNEHVRALDHRLQRMFIMRLQGHTHAEIAEEVESKPGATRMTLSRLRRRVVADLGRVQGINFEDHDDSSATR